MGVGYFEVVDKLRRSIDVNGEQCQLAQVSIPDLIAGRQLTGCQPALPDREQRVLEAGPNSTTLQADSAKANGSSTPSVYWFVDFSNLQGM